MPDEASTGRALVIRVEQQDSSLVLRLTGDFDWACVGRVEAALERIEPTTEQVVFDLQGLTSLDSSGLKTILRANDRARTEAFDVVVVRPRGLANRVFTLTRAGDELTMVDRPPQLTAATWIETAVRNGALGHSRPGR